ncbi:hypothetical protein M758_1G169100 [Ceratodon purpureus]|uniref:Secreted protein n=1 Tax=Ceratodon purpureus TaxID=3225 RepID=A0A8T0J827_CERPU|nr:hypothetical protein KC19_1G172500 [Ceratodon purpureus]KAG0630311.1 hypothetical protein M758_1G169100 [Ceratodon purpureus]
MVHKPHMWILLTISHIVMMKLPSPLQYSECTLSNPGISSNVLMQSRLRPSKDSTVGAPRGWRIDSTHTPNHAVS